MTLSPEHREILLKLARASITHGLETGCAATVLPEDYPDALKERRASFVTLTLGGALRGCIGRLQAECPLAQDVAENAFNAAFRDPRFPPLRASELGSVEIHVSVLSEPEPMEFDSETDLLRQIRPGIDGLILKDGAARGTFLPSVWESLPDASDFLRHLKAKAGLPADHWSNSLQVLRYETESFG